MAGVLLNLEQNLLSRFTALFSKGVAVQARTGCNLRDFVCEQLHIPEEYLEKRIQTIFLNGKAVDDYQTAMVTDGSSVALSAAMPGLVGAVFRRGGFYAGLRNTVTYRSDGASVCALNGIVTVKLFNLTVKELGPLMLANGIRVSGKDLQELLVQFAEDFRSGCRQALMDGKPVSVDKLAVRLADLDQVELKVTGVSG